MMSSTYNLQDMYSDSPDTTQNAQSVQVQEVQNLNITFCKEPNSEKKRQKANTLFPQQDIIPPTKNMTVSPQQQAYSRLIEFINKKKDYKNYPKISYEDFIMIDGLEENMDEDNIIYTNLLKGFLNLELIYQFMILLRERDNCSYYTETSYQIIPDLSYYKSYFNDYIQRCCGYHKNLVVCFKKENWNILIFAPNNNAIYLYLLDDQKLFMEGEIETVIDECKKSIYPGVPFQKVQKDDRSSVTQKEAAILPLVVMEYFSRNNTSIPKESNEIYYYGFLILYEVIKKKLITW